LNALDHARQQRLDFDKTLAAARTLLGDLELRASRLRRESAWSRGRARERVGGDLIADLYQCAQHRAIAHDLGVTPDVGRDGVFCAKVFRYTSPPASSAWPELCRLSNTVTASAGRFFSISREMWR